MAARRNPSAVQALRALLAFVATLAPALLLWSWLGKPVELPAVPGGRLPCLSYTPYDASSTPLDGEGYRVDPAVIRADLALLKGVTGCIRTYAALGPAAAVVEAAQALGLEVMQGIWISGAPPADRAEIEAGLALAARYPETVTTLIVGNEVLLRYELDGAGLAALIAEVRARSPVPVAYGDVDDYWLKNPLVAEAVDLILIHILPYWIDPPVPSVEEAQAVAWRAIARAQGAFPDKRVMVGEIGWPSAGQAREAAVASRIDAARFLREFAAEAARRGLAYNVIEALDQPWKRHQEGTAGGHWGLFDSAREQKFPLVGPVSEWPRWPLALAVTGAVAAGVTAVVALVARALPLWRWLLIAGLGQLCGATLVFQARFLVEWAQGVVDWLLGGAAVALSLAAAASLAALIVGRGPWAEARPGAFFEIVAWLKRPRLRALTPALLLGLHHWAVALPAAMVSLGLAVDGRYRSVPLSLFLIPALAVVLRWLLLERGEIRAERREEAWLAAVLMGAGLGALDGPYNLDAQLWCALSLAFALAWLGALRGELGRLRRLAAEPRRA